MAERFDSPLASSALGQRIRSARKGRGLTLMDLERAIKVNHGQISRIERGAFSTKSKNVHRLCTFLKIKDHALVTTKARNTSLQKRLEQLLLASPQYAMLFAAVLDALEARTSTAKAESPG